MNLKKISDQSVVSVLSLVHRGHYIITKKKRERNEKEEGEKEDIKEEKQES